MKIEYTKRRLNKESKTVITPNGTIWNLKRRYPSVLRKTFLNK